MCKLNLQLSKLLEISKEYKSAAQNLRYCIAKVIEYRDKIIIRGPDSKLNAFLPTTISVSQYKIDQTLQKMKETYVNSKNQLCRLIRKKQK